MGSGWRDGLRMSALTPVFGLIRFGKRNRPGCHDTFCYTWWKHLGIRWLRADLAVTFLPKGTGSGRDVVDWGSVYVNGTGVRSPLDATVGMLPPEGAAGGRSREDEIGEVAFPPTSPCIPPHKGFI